MLEGLRQVFRSKIKTLEILYVLEGKKPCARILVNEKEQNSIEALLKNHKLNFEISDFKLLKEDNLGLYSDKSAKASRIDKRQGYLVYYISKDNLSSKAKNLEASNDHIDLGLLLGYPRCCCEFFLQYFNKNNADLTLDTFRNSKGFEFSFPMNICTRHFDISLLSHFPCSFNCKKSLDIAKNNLNLIKGYSKDLADVFEISMKSTVIYAQDEGIHILRTSGKLEDEVYYVSVISTSNNKMHYLLSSNNKIKIVDKNNFTVDDCKINGPLFIFK